MDEQYGDRIAALIDALTPSVTRKAFAERVGMKPDALSRALSGQRGISSIELVRIADALDADIYELVTGEPDPRAITVAARHNYDRQSGTRSVPTRDADEQTIESVRIAYVQAGGLTTHEPVTAPVDPAAMRLLLGDGFARPFINRVESLLGVDVIRVAELGTAYTATIEGRSVIIIPAKGNWFRENWDLAHELAHLARITDENDADRFASELLLPKSLMTSVDWTEASPQTVADFLWETGVSTDALRNRISYLRLGTPQLRDSLRTATQRFLRSARSWSHAFGDEITERMDAAAQRRFPLALQEAHEKRVEAGEIGPAYLAWMRGIDERWVAETYQSERVETGVDDLAGALGLDID